LKDYGGEQEPPMEREPVKKSDDALGFVFPAYMYFRKVLGVGVIYRPSFYRPNMTDKFQYEHLISIDFVWKIRLKK
jgi:hypothetical protein